MKSLRPRVATHKRHTLSSVKTGAKTGAEADAETIDRLYGLDPVIDTESEGNEGANPTQFVTIACPYCGEFYETRIDLTAGSFDYVEDCQICCQPIDLRVEVNDAAELETVIARQTNA
jgi:hypothetical protein